MLASCVLLLFSVISVPAVAATTKAGGACTKVGAKSGSLVCAKVNGKLIWKINKRSQKIVFSPPASMSVTDKSASLTYSATSGLKVASKTVTPTICTVNRWTVFPTGTAGLCQISLEQGGSSLYFPAKKVVMSFNIHGLNFIDFKLPAVLLLSQGNIQLTATASSNTQVTYISNTPDVCTVSGSTLNLIGVGTCTVVALQTDISLIPPVDPVTQSVEISAGRVASDLPDYVSGFQIKPIYVVPSDGTDHSYDTDGYLSGILNEGNAYLKGQIGQTVPIDSTQSGYDIQYLHSKYSTSYLQSHADAPEASSDGYVLFNEIKAMENPGVNRKDYIFFIDVAGFGGTFCGMAKQPGMYAVVALQNISSSNICKGPSAPYFTNYVAKTWVHEMLHNFGVGHTKDDPCDLMAGKPETPGTCTAADKWTMDKERTRYVNASAQGQDIMKLRVWQGFTDNQGLQADCILDPMPRQDGLHYAYCPTGTQLLGALSYCWSGSVTTSLEEQVNGIWVPVGAGSLSNRPWGSRLTWTCNDATYGAPQKLVNVTTPGIIHYRWLINGQPKEEFNVIWVN